MGKITYNEASFNTFKDTINSCNNDILDAIKDISTEVDNIEQTLKTPRSVITTENFDTYFKDKIDFLSNITFTYEDVLDGIIDTYQENLSNVNKMVGGKND